MPGTHKYACLVILKGVAISIPPLCVTVLPDEGANALVQPGAYANRTQLGRRNEGRCQAPPGRLRGS